ncbi:uncharacterized protein LOC134823072 [Bolinopsis microptera]|uniref:uncharacterized protein LOC134823072 n=1 Tax=Bolinopsis microptera TaxID=2820187 RepID=UPI00307ADABA
MYNITEFQQDPNYKIADITIGTLYICCFLFGLPANLLSLFYFTRQQLKSMDLPTYLYTLAALQDATICFLCFNHGITMLRLRELWLPGACSVHHILFQMSQRMSVFLVATLSCTRTYTLVYPLKRVNRKTVLRALAVLWVLMTCFFVIPPSINLVRITYHWEGGYCWADPIPGESISILWDTIDNAMDTAGLAFPVVPITLSCVISAQKILVVRQVKDKRTKVKYAMRRSSLKIESTNRKATGTIIMVTIMYILSNIPLFINYVLYLITITSLEYPGPIYNSPAMYFYSWNVTAILLTGLNAAANPVVYFTRFKSLREWVRGGCLRGTTLSRQHASRRFISSADNYKLLPANYGIRRRNGRIKLRDSLKFEVGENRRMVPIIPISRNGPDCDRIEKVGLHETEGKVLISSFSGMTNNKRKGGIKCI